MGQLTVWEKSTLEPGLAPGGPSGAWESGGGCSTWVLPIGCHPAAPRQDLSQPQCRGHRGHILTYGSSMEGLHCCSHHLLCFPASEVN